MGCCFLCGLTIGEMAQCNVGDKGAGWLDAKDRFELCRERRSFLNDLAQDTFRVQIEGLQQSGQTGIMPVNNLIKSKSDIPMDSFDEWRS